MTRTHTYITIHTCIFMSSSIISFFTVMTFYFKRKTVLRCWISACKAAWNTCLPHCSGLGSPDTTMHPWASAFETLQMQPLASQLRLCVASQVHLHTWSPCNPSASPSAAWEAELTDQRCSRRAATQTACGSKHKSKWLFSKRKTKETKDTKWKGYSSTLLIRKMRKHKFWGFFNTNKTSTAKPWILLAQKNVTNCAVNEVLLHMKKRHNVTLALAISFHFEI